MASKRRKQSKATRQNKTQDAAIAMGHEELTIRQRYETLSILNDFLIAIWFLVGSIFFLYSSLQTAGVWLFIVGSAQFLIRPAIRLSHQIHLRRIPSGHWDM